MQIRDGADALVTLRGAGVSSGGRWLVRGVDFAVQPGEIVTLIGPNGSGKSTTLAAMIDWRNENAFDHIITIEDPIEFIHDHKNCIVTQREVGVDTDNWFAALKNTLRQAPDVIMIGEIRDRETMD